MAKSTSPMFSIVISILPHPVIIILAVGQALLSVNSHTKEWIESFGLTEDQIGRIKLIENEYENSINKFEEEIEASEILLTLLIVGTGSIEQLKQKEHELEALKIEATQVYFEKFLAIRNVLTPAQLLEKCEIYTLTKEQRMKKFSDIKSKQN